MVSMPRFATFLIIMIGLAIALPKAAAQESEDRHEGYYYPPVTTFESYPARSPTDPTANRVSRLAFVSGLAQDQTSRPYPPRWSIYAKGAASEKLIIVAIEDGVIASEYQARAMLALMTAVARNLPFFDQTALEGNYTFFDLLALLGFEQLTISDGRSYAIQYEILLQETGR